MTDITKTRFFSLNKKKVPEVHENTCMHVYTLTVRKLCIYFDLSTGQVVTWKHDIVQKCSICTNCDHQEHFWQYLCSMYHCPKVKDICMLEIAGSLRSTKARERCKEGRKGKHSWSKYCKDIFHIQKSKIKMQPFILEVLLCKEAC